MAAKKSFNYFDSFIRMADFSCQAAELLDEIMNNYDPKNQAEMIKKMNEIEHKGDMERHEMIRNLLHEFITPIEREDIMALADATDTVTDMIEDVALRLYMYNVKEIYEGAKGFSTIIVKSSKALKLALEEFHNFRKSKTLHGLIVDVNTLEEEADALYTKAMRNLYLHSTNVRQIIAWDQTLDYLEMCCDSCEEVANVIENIVMKNS